MDQKILTYKEVAFLISTSPFEPLGDRVAVLVDSKAETFGDSVIQRADIYTAPPPTGYIVAVSESVDPDRGDKIPVGTRVLFQNGHLNLDKYSFGDSDVQLAVMSSKDVYAILEDPE